MSKSPTEQRELRFHATEVRMADAVEGEENRTLTGVLVPYNKTANLRYYSEQFAPGAFADSLADTGHNKRALYHHDAKDLLASTQNDTFRLIDTPDALRFEMDVAKTKAGDDAIELVRSGEMRGTSVGFQTLDDAWTYDDATDHATRTIKKGRLVEGSLTTIPAYSDTEVSLRSADQEEAIIAKIEELRSSAKSSATPELEKRWRVYRELQAESAA